MSKFDFQARLNVVWHIIGALVGASVILVLGVVFGEDIELQANLALGFFGGSMSALWIAWGQRTAR